MKDVSINLSEHPAKTPEYFRNEALKTIERLSVPRKTITELQSTLVLIMQKHDFDTSYLDELAKWFKHEAWWYEAKSILFLGATAMSVAYIPPLLAILSGISIIITSLYCITKFFLIDHYDRTYKRENRIKNHIASMQQHIINAVSLLNETENQLNRMLITLCEINSQLADNIEIFEKQIAELNAQVPQFLSTIAELEKLTHSLNHDNEGLTTQLHNAMNEIEKSKANIEQGQAALGSITGSLAETNHELNAVCEKVHSSLASLGKISTAYHEQLMKNHSAEEIITQLQTSTHETLMKKSDAALSMAELALKQFDANIDEALISNEVPASNYSLGLLKFQL